MSTVSDAINHPAVSEAKVVRVRDCRSYLPISIELLRAHRDGPSSTVIGSLAEAPSAEKSKLTRTVSAAFEEWEEHRHFEQWDSRDAYDSEDFGYDNADLPTMR